MRKFSKLFLSALLFLGFPVAAQEADSAFYKAAQPVDSLGNVDLTPWEFRQLVRSQRYARKQRIRIERLAREPYRPQHDLRVMFGFAPMFDGWGVPDWDGYDLGNPAYEVLHSKYYNSLFGRHSLGALSVSYAYRIGQKWEIGAALSFTRISDNLYPAPDGLESRNLREYYLSVMPGVRYSWICNSRFRLYSAAEGGAQLAMRRDFFECSYWTEMRATGQFTVVGFTLGRNFFWGCELGAGCRGVFVTGIGWRFDAKNAK